MAITREEKAAVDLDSREAFIDVARAKSALNTLRLMNAMNFAPFEGNQYLERTYRSRVVSGADMAGLLPDMLGLDGSVLTSALPGDAYPTDRNLRPMVVELPETGRAVLAGLDQLRQRNQMLVLSGIGVCPAVTSFGDCIATVQDRSAFEAAVSKPGFTPEVISTVQGGLGVQSGRGGLGPLILEKVFVTGESCTKEVAGRKTPRLLGPETITNPNICALVTHLEDRVGLVWEPFSDAWVAPRTDVTGSTPATP